MNRYIHLDTAWRYIITAFFVGTVLGCLIAYVWTDDARIEQDEQLVRISKIVESHYRKECNK